MSTQEIAITYLSGQKTLGQLAKETGFSYVAIRLLVNEYFAEHMHALRKEADAYFPYHTPMRSKRIPYYGKEYNIPETSEFKIPEHQVLTTKTILKQWND